MMIDLFYITLTLLFFGLSFGLVGFFNALQEDKS